MSNAVDTLFYPLQQGFIQKPDPQHKICFFNARAHPFLDKLDQQALTVQQYFKPYQDELLVHNLIPEACVESVNDSVDLALLLLPKNAVEARYTIANGLKSLRAGGTFVCAADNKAGGSRIKKMLQQFGVKNLKDASKNKARVVWFEYQAVDENAVDQALTAGGPQDIINGRFLSTPGIYGWDKIDKGSELLAEHLPTDIKGRAADLGCGYGYLSDALLRKNNEITDLFCIDADIRAVQMCERNIKKNAAKTNCHFLWEDLSRHNNEIRDLDFIVMNPPFHEGKKTDISLGVSFIENAAQSLNKQGLLYMVANAHLPYEEVLGSVFSSHKKRAEHSGFKVFCAKK